MSTFKTLVARILLDSLYYSSIYKILENNYQGVGTLLTLHHVVAPEESSPFTVNRLLEISPEFLEQTIKQVQELGYDIVSLDEMHYRLSNKIFSKKFVCFTLDDGYVDNYTHAYPIFKKYNVPFAIYVSTGIIDGTAVLWWRCLEKIICSENQIGFVINGEEQVFEIVTLVQKQQVFNKLYWYLRGMPIDQQHALIFLLATKYQVCVRELCLNYAMSWEMLKEIAQDPLVTIGTHTVNHLALAKLSAEKVVAEVMECQDRLRQNIGIDANHFCYPYGDKASASLREFKIIEQLGFKSATTTQKEVVSVDMASHLYALPRIPLNGHYQEKRYVRLLLSGVPTGLWQQARHVCSGLLAQNKRILDYQAKMPLYISLVKSKLRLLT